MATVREIDDAPLLVEEYCSPKERYGWPLYDEDYARGQLTGSDLTSPALLSYPVRGELLNFMGSTAHDEYFTLVETMRTFIASTDVEDSFVDLTVDDIGNPKSAPMYWQHFINCLDAVQPCKQLTSVVVTKILHRKRPELVPINDTLVRAFYGAKNSYASLFKAIRADVTNEETQALLDKCREGRRTTDGRDMSRLRALDIIVWMHMKDRHLQK